MYAPQAPGVGLKLIDQALCKVAGLKVSPVSMPSCRGSFWNAVATVVAGGATVMGSAADALGANSSSKLVEARVGPLYLATILRVPGASAGVAKEATPPLSGSTPRMEGSAENTAE